MPHSSSHKRPLCLSRLLFLIAVLLSFLFLAPALAAEAMLTFPGAATADGAPAGRLAKLTVTRIGPNEEFGWPAGQEGSIPPREVRELIVNMRPGTEISVISQFRRVNRPWQMSGAADCPPSADCAVSASDHLFVIRPPLASPLGPLLVIGDGELASSIVYRSGKPPEDFYLPGRRTSGATIYGKCGAECLISIKIHGMSTSNERVGFISQLLQGGNLARLIERGKS